MQSLNVLIGPNGAGKSNLIEAIGLLQSAPTNLLDPIRAGGGIAEWLWKGSDGAPVAEIDTTVFNPPKKVPLRHNLKFTWISQRTELVDEEIENERLKTQGDLFSRGFYYRYAKGHPVLNVKKNSATGSGREQRVLRREDLARDQSVLSQRKDPDQYPEVTYLGREYAKIKLFREWNFGRNTQPRRPQPTDLAADFLSEDAAGLEVVACGGRRRAYDRFRTSCESGGTDHQPILLVDSEAPVTQRNPWDHVRLRTEDGWRSSRSFAGSDSPHGPGYGSMVPR